MRSKKHLPATFSVLLIAALLVACGCLRRRLCHQHPLNPAYGDARTAYTGKPRSHADASSGSHGNGESVGRRNQQRRS